MAEDRSQSEKQNGKRAGEHEEQREEMLQAAPLADAKHYVLQPTSAELPEALQNAPKDRFQEEVLKGSDEDSGDGVEAHPEENRA